VSSWTTEVGILNQWGRLATFDVSPEVAYNFKRQVERSISILTVDI
jgi:hypothetical protein